jgi:hypothetical protein
VAVSWEDGDGGRFPRAPERGHDVAQRWMYANLSATTAEINEMAFKIELGWGTPRDEAKQSMMRVLINATRG